ncbi:SDR family oxidoreductase [Roseibium denhamense]|uniref:Short-chain dehydrogenase n=1 Tax=Roseibium denhamense TaxID=76305 RepID=A0ABY1NRU9_9HYPH|nr:SDR family oxidoreductase [Roseibium denhamense]MTI08127.1 SDR family oxidoreductase [Roseibium denhamense]SMP16610.1 Short-chain dehydrogenase [Roseibium denhamense]
MPVCLITATNRGIGFELAKEALRTGWTVYGSVRSDDMARTTQDALGDGFTPLIFDVTDHDAVKRTAGTLSIAVDLLINNAGIIGPKRQLPLDMDFDGFRQTLEINTLAPLAITQAFLPHLRKSSSPKIITISSQMSWMGYRKPDTLAYRASKVAVNKVMQGLASELEPDGIPVAVVDPGWVRTDMGGPAADNCPEDVAKGILKTAVDLDISGTGKFFKWSGEERPF